MHTLSISEKNSSIILTTGIFDLLKEQIRRKKLTPFNESKLIEQLRNAKQVLRREMPTNVVDVNTKVELLDLETNQETTLVFVGPEKARRKNNTVSIITPLGLALIGYPVGEEVTWEMENEKKKYKIKNVSAIKSL